MLVRLLFFATLFTSPVPGPVTQRFVAPACQRCAGHRGITIDNPDGVIAVSPVAGTISFAGTVANKLYVVVEISPGVLVTVGRLQSLAVAKGDEVTIGQQVGVAGETTYLGVRVRGQYVEPLRYFGLGAARLVGSGVVVGRRPFSR